MIGDMIARIRKEKKLTKTKLADKTGINIGHLTHIEKEERNPSHRALKTICKALEIPNQPLIYTYDKELNEDFIMPEAFDPRVAEVVSNAVKSHIHA